MSQFFVIPAKAGTQRNRKNWVPAFAGMTMMLAAPASAQEKQPPYWASLASGQAMTHTGPGRNYPNVWLYQRRDLPVRVVKKYETWRLIQDPDGAQGWMLVSMLSDRRTAIVRPGDPRPIRADPNEGANVRYRAEHGLVGRISKCRDGWCRIEIGNRQGYIKTSDIWGVGKNEVVG
ncbi:MAG TPA: SH3 domain-containing protein [Sphingomicrobium sp.]|nr:SH3 domain-containing protein [Sphingomicrobium sp.]